MKCNKCGSGIKNGEESEHHGQLLCEDCYMDALSPARTCDPWAVHAAKSFADKEIDFTEIQRKILDILKETNGVKPEDLAKMLHVDFKTVEREIAALRHMEKVKAKMLNGNKVICLW